MKSRLLFWFFLALFKDVTFVTDGNRIKARVLFPTGHFPAVSHSFWVITSPKCRQNAIVRCFACVCYWAIHLKRRRRLKANHFSRGKQNRGGRKWWVNWWKREETNVFVDGKSQTGPSTMGESRVEPIRDGNVTEHYSSPSELVSRDERTFSCVSALFALDAVGKPKPFLKCFFFPWLLHDRWLCSMANGSSWKRNPFFFSRPTTAPAMMMKRRVQVKMGAQQYHQTAGHPRDIQTRSDRELVFLLQKEPSQRTVHVSHFQLHAAFTVDPIRKA